MRAKGMLPSEAEESILLYEEGYSLASIGRPVSYTHLDVYKRQELTGA